MLDVLSAAGRADLAGEVVGQKTFPGWGHMLAGGATTLWEHWEFSDNTYSHNHPMFGSVSGWFYSALAGINPEPTAPGFQRIRIEPQVVRDLRWASGSVDTPRGQIASSWSRMTQAPGRSSLTTPPFRS